MTAYYNEIEPKAAAWLRELIKAALIADGEVDERDIQDIRPADLHGFTQCHFFAGIGVWSYSLRCAGWPDDRPIWTASCPCQPFSAAGKGGGFADERHLWPAFHWLLEQCEPDVAVGEQVASKDGLAWLDLVQADLEGSGYASGAVDTCAAGFGAPHIRQRLYWLAYAGHSGFPVGSVADDRRGTIRVQGAAVASGVLSGIVANADGGQRDGIAELRWAERDRADARRPESGGELIARGLDGRSGPTNGLWRDADWLFCRDGKWRPVSPGTFPLVDGSPARVGRLRGYGNAIVAPQAAAFIEAVAEILMDAVPQEAAA